MKPTDDDLPGQLDLDPLLMELLRRIPSKADGWPKEQRLRWFKTFAVNVSEVYDDATEPVDLKVELLGSTTNSGHGE